MENFNYFEKLKNSLEDVLAYEEGDTSRCKVLEPQKSKPSQGRETTLRSGKVRVLSQRKTSKRWRNLGRSLKKESKSIERKAQTAVKQQS